MPLYNGTVGSGGGQVWSVNQSSATAQNGSTTLFTTPATYIIGTLKVHLNGMRLKATGDYTETSTSSFTFVAAPIAADVILVDYRTI